MWCKRTLAAFTIALSIASAGGAQALTRLTDADTQVSSKNPTTNYGNQSTAEVGREMSGMAANVLRALLHFDLSGLGPAANITDAKLRLFVNSTTMDPLGLALTLNLLAAPFDENTVTWDTQPTVLPTPTVSGTMNTPPGMWFSIDVTSLVQAALSGGMPNDLYLRIGAVDETTNDDQNFTFLTRESGAATAPELVVNTFTIEAPVLSSSMATLAVLMLAAIAIVSLSRRRRLNTGE